MAAEIESELHESSELIQSSGGVFEVEENGTLIFSKKGSGRFPGEGEVLSIVGATRNGMTLEEARKVAVPDTHPSSTFVDWIKTKLSR